MSTLSCPQKEICGSCPWSEFPYERQLEMKLADIRGALSAQELPCVCNEVVPSPVTSHYRNRMDFAIDFEGRVGLRQKGKWWRVIDNHHCFISDERIEDAFSVIRDWVRAANLSYFDRKKHVGLLRYAVLRATLTGELMATIVTSMPKDTAEATETRSKLQVLAEKLGATTVLWAKSAEVRDVSFGTEEEIISGPGVIREVVDGFNFEISPNAFFQTNSRGAALLLRQVHTFLDRAEAQGAFLDLFCGTGFFSIACAKRMCRTCGIEIVPDAVKDAQRNAALNGLQIEFQHTAAEAFVWKDLAPEVLLVDPPRAGLHPRALRAVVENRPRVVIYVSCNYKAFAAEMTQLGPYYELLESRAVDMFPHTPHVELISLLIAKK
jgi:23S rRNA (uracil-5-)-methyltransferase RumA